MSLSPTERVNQLPSGSTSVSPSDVNESALASGASPRTAPPASHDHHGRVRSCTTCHLRKVGCNRRTPCSNCARAGIDCVYPPPGRAPRKRKRPQDPELQARLQNLERTIAQLQQVKYIGANADGLISPISPEQQAANSTGGQSQDGGDEGCPFSDPKKPAQPRPLEHEFGRLVIDEGRSRYVSNRLWASLGDEIEELQDILDPPSSDEEDHPSPESSSSYSISHDGFLFGYYSLSNSLRRFHPTPSQILTLRNLFKENVALVLPVVWTPHALKIFNSAAESLDGVDKNSEALLFAMYIVTIVSMTNEQCLSTMGQDRDALVSRYRFACEQSLARSNILCTQSVMLLQAAIIFLNAVRALDDTKYVWSMTALVLRLAEGLGLHRDGTHFGLNPFETEIRRRVWWHISLLDHRSSEDHGTEVQIRERMSDTRLPLNINEDDLSPDMEELPLEREGFTDMSFHLVRVEIHLAMRRVSSTCPAPGGPSPGHKQLIPDKCGNVIQAVNNRIEERYLRHCDMSVPIQWMTATMARLILTQLWLTIHHPMTRPDRPINRNNASRESLFVTSVELAEFGRFISDDKNTSRWTWAFATHSQWHVLAFVLSELCVRPLSPLTDRAWEAVHALYEVWVKTARQKKGILWRSLSRLMARAAAFRAKQREELEAQRGQASSSPQEAPGAPTRGAPSLGSSLLPQMPHFQPPTAPLLPGGGIDFDMSKGPIGVINDFFPNANWLATPNPQNISEQLPPTVLNGAISIPTEPPPQLQPDPSNLQLNWEEWDQVMREFQTDLREESGNPASNTHGWIP